MGSHWIDHPLKGSEMNGVSSSQEARRSFGRDPGIYQSRIVSRYFGEAENQTGSSVEKLSLLGISRSEELDVGSSAPRGLFS